MIRALHHVQLAMPRGREDEARAFYRDVRSRKTWRAEAVCGSWRETRRFIGAARKESTSRVARRESH